MARLRRSSDPALVRQRLEKKKSTLDATVAKFSDRKSLSATEQVAEKELKKKKLAMKDAIAQL